MLWKPNEDYASQLVYSNRLSVVGFKFTCLCSTSTHINSLIQEQPRRHLCFCQFTSTHYRGGLKCFYYSTLMNDDVNQCFGSSVLCTSYFTEFYYTYVKVREGARTSARTASFPLAPVTIPDSHRARALLLTRYFTGRVILIDLYRRRVVWRPLFVWVD